VHVTGAGGFIGRHLVPALARAGHEVQPAPAGADVIVHLAGIAHRKASAEELQEVNVRLPERVARQAPRFVFMSSVKVHGERSTAPFTERSPIRPADAYGESKARAEDALRSIAGLKLAVLRPPLVYGPRVKANFLALMRAVARGWPLPLASVRNARTFVALDNLVDLLALCSTHPAAANQLLLAADAEDLSTPELVRCIAAGLGVPARLLPAPPGLLRLGARMLGRERLADSLLASLQVDASRARRLLGWQPPVRAAEGVRRAAQESHLP